MHPVIRNILAVLAGVIVGSIINMGLVEIGHRVFPVNGVDLSNIESLAVAMPQLEPKHFIFPFLAHALGTLGGAYVAARAAVSHKMRFAFGIGVFFLIGGVMMNYLVSGPFWFSAIDLIVAYIPMAWIGGMLVQNSPGNEPDPSRLN